MFLDVSSTIQCLVNVCTLLFDKRPICDQLYKKADDSLSLVGVCSLNAIGAILKLQQYLLSVQSSLIFYIFESVSTLNVT